MIYPYVLHSFKFSAVTGLVNQLHADVYLLQSFRFGDLLKEMLAAVKAVMWQDLQNGPIPSCCLSRFRSESWCSTIVREMSLICIRIRNTFKFE